MIVPIIQLQKRSNMATVFAVEYLTYKYKKTKYLTTNQNQKQGIMILYKNSEFSESCI